MTVGDQSAEQIRAILVGESNPFGGGSEFALYPIPETSSGGRLARILGLSNSRYLRAFDRVNLVRGRWSAPVARMKAAELVDEHPGRPLVLLGSKVSAAFRIPYEPFGVRLTGPGLRASFCILPHPSGLCRAWNDPAAIHRARRAVRLLLSVGIDDVGECAGSPCACDVLSG